MTLELMPGTSEGSEYAVVAKNGQHILGVRPWGIVSTNPGHTAYLFRVHVKHTVQTHVTQATAAAAFGFDPDLIKQSRDDNNKRFASQVIVITNRGLPSFGLSFWVDIFPELAAKAAEYLVNALGNGKGIHAVTDETELAEWLVKADPQALKLKAAAMVIADEEPVTKIVHSPLEVKTFVETDCDPMLEEIMSKPGATSSKKAH